MYITSWDTFLILLRVTRLVTFFWLVASICNFIYGLSLTASALAAETAKRTLGLGYNAGTMWIMCFFVKHVGDNTLPDVTYTDALRHVPMTIRHRQLCTNLVAPAACAASQMVLRMLLKI